MPTYRGYRSIPAGEGWGPIARDLINRMLRGKLNICGEVTLAPGVEATTLTDQQIGTASVVVLMPMSANAALALTGVWFCEPAAGSVVINHATSETIDRTFRYIVMG